MPTDLTRLFLPFSDVQKSTIKGADGKDIDVRLVKGLMTDESLDLDQQKVDFDWAKGAAEKWHSRWGNIREQHSSNAIGKSVDLAILEEQKAVDLTGKIVDPGAIVKTDEKILQGWSVGIKGARTVKDATAPNGRIVGGEIVEVSLVDHPANENCKVALVKSAKSGRLQDAEQKVTEKLATAEETKLADVDAEKAAPSDGHGHLHTHNEGSDQEYSHDHGHQHADGDMHGDGEDADHQHDHMGTMGGKVVEPDVAKRDYSDKERKSMSDAGTALPDGSYPIADVADLKNAIQAVGRAKDPDAAKAHIKKRAKALGASDQLPDDWKAVEAETGKATMPGLTGIQEQHNAPLQQLISAVQTLVQQESSEPVVDWYDVQCLVDIGTKAQQFAQSESWESDSAVYMAALPQVAKLVGSGERADRKVAIQVLKSAAVIDDKLKATQAEKPKEAVVETKPATETATESTTPPATEPSAPSTDKSVTADTMKAAISEAVTKAVETAIKPLREKVDEMGKRAAPGGPILGGSKMLRAPDDVQAKILGQRVDIATVRDWAENHPDGSIRMGMKQILADLEKGAAPS